MGRYELLTTDQMAEADRCAVALGVRSLTLMENAGRAVADEATKMVPKGGNIIVLCGPGNNGGDGFVAARLLKEGGYDVRVSCLVPADALKGDAAEMARLWDGEISPFGDNRASGPALYIDALFGAGLSRKLTGDAAAWATCMDGEDVPVLAVDVPSGLDGDTGAPRDDAVVHATRTVTFFRKKTGHLLMPGRKLCGEVVVADIGIPASVLASIAPKTTTNALALWAERFPWPRLDGHKYSRGHAVIVSGSGETSGAARLAARGALRVGAGLVTLVGGPAATAINAMHTNAIMVRKVEGAAGLAEFLADHRRNAVLIGPGAGVGAETAADVLTALASNAAAVLDADALTSFAQRETGAKAGFGFVVRSEAAGSSAADLHAAIKRRAAPAVLTPHEGEFSRLFGDVAPINASKLDRARAAARLSGAIVILKGGDTVIAAPDGQAAINENAPPWLATAGSGDVLAGFITGLLAQGMPAFEAACTAVWLHGEVADHVGPGLIAEDLPERLPDILASLHLACGSPVWKFRGSN